MAGHRLDAAIQWLWVCSTGRGFWQGVEVVLASFQFNQMDKPKRQMPPESTVSGGNLEGGRFGMSIWKGFPCQKLQKVRITSKAVSGLQILYFW